MKGCQSQDKILLAGIGLYGCAVLTLLVSLLFIIAIPKIFKSGAGRHAPGFLKLLWCERQYACLCVCVCVCA